MITQAPVAIDISVMCGLSHSVPPDILHQLQIQMKEIRLYGEIGMDPKTNLLLTFQKGIRIGISITLDQYALHLVHMDFEL